MNVDNHRLCPYIQALINNDDFKNIKCDIDDVKIEEDGEETDADSVNRFNSQNKIKYFLPFDKIDISILINDIWNTW